MPEAELRRFSDFVDGEDSMDTVLHFFLEESCLFRQMTGLYCPGCGGTRALLALLQGHPVKSLLYHPAVLYSFLLLGALGVSWGLSRISRRKLRGLTWRMAYLWAGLVLVVGNWLLRNLLLVAFGIPIG